MKSILPWPRGNGTSAGGWAAWRIALACVVAATSGCASLRRNVVPESVTDCRRLSQQGVAALELGEGARAQQLLTEAVAKNPGDFDARRQLAEALWREGHAAEAAAQLAEAVRLDPRHAPTVVRAGELQLELGNVEAALEFADRAVALDGSFGGGWALRAAARRQRGEFTAALSDLHQALRFQPNATTILMQEAELQFQLGRPQRCLNTLHHLMDVYAPGEEPQQALWLEGLAYGAVGRPREAAESLWAAARRGPPSAELLYQLAKAQRAAGREGAAIEAARQALATDADHMASRELLASMEATNSPADEVLRR